MSELVNNLRKTTRQAEISQRRAEGKHKAAEKRKNNALAKKLTEETAVFVDDNLPHAIEGIEDGLGLAAAAGKTVFNQVWSVKRGEGDSLPMEELIRYEALRDSAAEYFAEQGLAVSCINGRDSYEDRRGPSDDGYYPSVLTNHRVGLTLSW